MSSAPYRHNGGLGFYIDQPDLSVEVSEHSENLLIDQREQAIPEKPFLTWLDTHLSTHNIPGFFRIEISGNTPSHKGFGVSTAVRMAAVEGIYELIGRDVSQEQIILDSHRGGTSGVGVHGYFTGGFVFDLGHTGQRAQYQPSRSKESSSHLPLLMKQLPMPEWELGILIPSNIEPKSHEEEKNFFERTCPIRESCVFEATYHALFGVLAAVQTADFKQFCLAINALQQQTWKKAERALYPELPEYEKLLKDAGSLAVGMSSLGPSLYFFADDIDLVINQINRSTYSSTFKVFKATTANHGRAIVHV